MCISDLTHAVLFNTAWVSVEMCTCYIFMGAWAKNLGDQLFPKLVLTHLFNNFKDMQLTERARKQRSTKLNLWCAIRAVASEISFFFFFWRGGGSSQSLEECDLKDKPIEHILLSSMKMRMDQLPQWAITDKSSKATPIRLSLELTCVVLLVSCAW